jgi:hypothetical protein
MYKSCTVLITPSDTYYYDMFIKTSTGDYAIIPVSFNGASGPFYRRFSLAPYPLGTTFYSSVTLQFTYAPPLLTPYLLLSQALPAQIINNSSTQSASLTLLIPFAIF